MRRPSDRRRAPLARRPRSPRGFLPGLQALEGRQLLTNAPPVLGPIGDQLMPTSQDVLTLTLAATDPDGDPIAFAVEAESLAAHLDQQLNLGSTGDYITNWGGRGEKWMTSDTGWHFILPDGALYRWDGSGQATGALAATLDPSYHADPARLHNARSERLAYQLDRDLGLSFTGNYETNWGGRNEAWMQSRGGQWYFITPDGGLYRWDGTGGPGAGPVGGPLVATLDPSYHADPSDLHDAPIEVSVTGSTLTIDPAAGVVGAFVVTATADDGHGGTDSESFTVTVVAERPSPGGLTATATSSTAILLSWQDIAGEAGYRIERSHFGFDWAPIGSVAADVTSFTVGGLSEGAIHRYRVVASDALGDFPPSDAVYGVIPWSTPVIVSPVSANPPVVSGTEATLSALGDVAAGEATLRYTWSVVSLPAGALHPSFSENGTNAAKTTTATFSSAGAYTFRVAVANGSQVVTSDVSVTVQQTLTSIAVGPPYTFVMNGEERHFTAKAKDQFGHDMAAQPTFAWSLGPDSPGQLSSTGLYTAPESGNGAVLIQATAGSIASTASVDVGYRDVVIDFDDLPAGTVVTDQYPFITISGDPAYPNRIIATTDASQPNSLGAPTPGGPAGGNPFIHPLYVDFSVPVNGLRFYQLRDNATGTIAEIRIFERGTHTATVPMIGTNDTFVPNLVDLSDFRNVTRIEIVNITDPAGLLWDDFSFSSTSLDLIAHRAGGKLGEAVAEEVEDGGDPATYLILTNNDFEEDPDGGDRDFDDDTAVIPTGGGPVVDDDLARITLKRLPAGLTSGTVEVVLSNPDAVRLFRSDGTQLYREGQTGPEALTLDLANPTGYLADLLSGDVDVWLEGLEADEHFVFAVVYRDSSGRVIAGDEVHLTLADWTFRGYHGEEVTAVAPVWKEALLAAAGREDAGITADPEGAFFKVHIDGLPPSAVSQLQVSSDDEPSDYYFDEFVDLPDRTVSRSFAALYSSDHIYLADPDAPVTATERTAIKQALDLNVVHNPGMTAILTTAQDIQKRTLTRRGFVNITLVDDDGVFNVGDVVQGTISGPADERWTLVVEAGDGLYHHSGRPPGNQLAFNFTVGAEGDIVIRAKGTRFQIEADGIANSQTFDNSVLIRVLPAGQAMPIWEQRAWDALRDGAAMPGDPIERNRRISRLYAEMYNSNPDVFKWAGMAAHVSYFVGDGMAEAESWVGVVGPPFAPDPKIGLDLLAIGNLDVYDGLYPQMLAYRDGGGIEAIEAMFGDDPDRQQQLNAWRKIATGNQALVWEGNQDLLEFEQRVTLQNGAYAANLQYWADFTNHWNPLVPDIISPIPGDDSDFQSFRTQHGDISDDASLGDFDARWAWIVREQMPAYKDWSVANRSIDVQRLLNGGYKKR